MDYSRLLELIRLRMPDLLALYVFGSQARGQAGPDSDLDLAILREAHNDPYALWSFAGELADEAGCPVDLVDLRSASTVMQYQIITTGQRIWALDARAGLYESFVLSEKTALDTARAELLADIQREGRVHGR